MHRWLALAFAISLGSVLTMAATLPFDADAEAKAFIAEHEARIKPLEKLARRSGAAKRTLERLFLAETGMAAGRWRQQLRL